MASTSSLFLRISFELLTPFSIASCRFGDVIWKRIYQSQRSLHLTSPQTPHLKYLSPYRCHYRHTQCHSRTAESWCRYSFWAYLSNFWGAYQLIFISQQVRDLYWPLRQGQIFDNEDWKAQHSDRALFYLLALRQSFWTSMSFQA